MATLEEIKNAARSVYGPVWSAAQSYGRDVKLYCHWTAGGYYTLYGDYHICIDADGGIHLMNDLTTLLSATYRRNSGSVSIALCCAYDAMAYTGGRYDLGSVPPTDAQIESMAQTVCVLADALDLTIDLDRVMTHAEAADNADGIYASDPYGPANGCERWDLAVLHDGDTWMSGGDIIRGKANFYRAQGLLR